MPRGARKPFDNPGRVERLRRADAAYAKTEAAAARARDELIAEILAALDEGATISDVARVVNYTREYLSREIPKWRLKAAQPTHAAPIKRAMKRTAAEAMAVNPIARPRKTPGATARDRMTGHEPPA